MDFASALVNLSQGLTLKRAVTFVVLIVLAVTGLLVFERYTNSFRLSRLQKAAEITAVLHKIEADSSEAGAAVRRLHDTIAAELEEALQAEPPSLDFPAVSLSAPRYAAWYKFLFGAALWILIALASLPSALRGSEPALGALFLAVFAGLFFGFIGLLIPSIFWPWVNLVGYPIAQPVLIIMMLFFVGSRQEANTFPRF